MDNMGKFTRVLKALNAKGERELFMALREAIKDLAANVEKAHDSEIADIKRRAGIVEFADTSMYGDNDSFGPDNSGMPSLSDELATIARSTQGSGRIDQHQIETIFRASQALKKVGQ